VRSSTSRTSVGNHCSPWIKSSGVASTTNKFEIHQHPSTPSKIPIQLILQTSFSHNTLFLSRFFLNISHARTIWEYHSLGRTSLSVSPGPHSRDIRVYTTSPDTDSCTKGIRESGHLHITKSPTSSSATTFANGPKRT